MSKPTHTDKDGNPKCCSSCARYVQGEEDDTPGLGYCGFWCMAVSCASLCQQWQLKDGPNDYCHIGCCWD